jgi:hypothetical protein
MIYDQSIYLVGLGRGNLEILSFIADRDIVGGPSNFIHENGRIETTVIMAPKCDRKSKITWKKSIPIPACLLKQFPVGSDAVEDYAIELELLCSLCQVTLIFGSVELIDKTNTTLKVNVESGELSNNIVEEFHYTFLSVDDYPLYETDISVYMQTTNFFDCPIDMSKTKQDNYRLTLVSLATCLNFWNTEGEDKQDGATAQSLEQAEWPTYTSSRQASETSSLSWNDTAESSFVDTGTQIEAEGTGSWNMEELAQPNEWKDELIHEVEEMKRRKLERKKRKELRRGGKTTQGREAEVASKQDGIEIHTKEVRDTIPEKGDFVFRKESFFCPKTFASLPGVKYATTELYRLECQLDETSQSKPKYYPLPCLQSADTYFCYCLVDNITGMSFRLFIPSLILR